jgi:hypothetical protein
MPTLAAKCAAKMGHPGFGRKGWRVSGSFGYALRAALRMTEFFVAIREARTGARYAR